MKPVTLFFLSLFAVSTCLAKSKPAPLTADSIISLSLKAYAHLKNYTDSGKLVQNYITNNPHKTATLFKTAYVNTGDFNFEYYVAGNSNSLYTINRTNNAVKTWWGVTNRTDAPANIQLALAGALGVSGSTSVMIPQLLLHADFKNNNLYSGLTQCAIAGQELVNGKDCYKITATGRRGPMTIWLGKKDFLIRKIETEAVIDPAKTEATAAKITALMKVKGDTANKDRQTALKTLAMIHKMDSLRGKPKQAAFTVKSSYTFYPTVASKINPDLLKFRPNREIVL